LPPVSHGYHEYALTLLRNTIGSSIYGEELWIICNSMLMVDLLDAASNKSGTLILATKAKALDVL
jgi:hypothetical protein